MKSEENETIECRIEAEKGTFWRSAGRTGEGGDRLLDQNCVFKCAKSEENETIECRIEAEKGTFWRSAGRTGEGGDRMLDQIACLNA